MTKQTRRWSFPLSAMVATAEETGVRTISERASARLQLRANVWKENSALFPTVRERLEPIAGKGKAEITANITDNVQLNAFA